MKKRHLIITAGAKGGSGKSLTTTIVYSWLKDRKAGVIPFDGDTENSTLSRFIPESRFVDMRNPRALDDILQPLETSQADTVLLDSRAATSEDMIQWFQQIGLAAINSELNTRVTVIAIVTHSRDTLEQLKWWTDELGDSVSWLIVRNLVGEQVDEYDQSKLRTKLLEALKGQEITIPKIPSFMVQMLESNNLTIHTARESGSLTWTNRRRFSTLEIQIFNQLNQIEKFLLP